MSNFKELEANSELKKAMLAAALDAIITIDVNGIVLEWNKAAENTYGWLREEALGKGITELIIPPEFASMHKLGIVHYMKTHEGPVLHKRIEIKAYHKNKTKFMVELAITPFIYNDEQYFTSCSRDITDRLKVEEHQKLLVRELNHRVRNNMAVVYAIARQTFKGAKDLAVASEVFTQRLFALTKAQEVLFKDNWKTSDIIDLTNEMLAIHNNPFNNRFRVTGLSYEIKPAFAIAYAIAVNELATNALKYGALYNAKGYVTIDWTIEENELNWIWQEHKGPPITIHPTLGFGTKLIRANLSAELGSTISIEFLPAGLICKMKIPAK